MEGVKEFAKTASTSYKSIGASEKDELRKKCCEESNPVTVKDIKKDREYSKTWTNRYDRGLKFPSR